MITYDEVSSIINKVLSEYIERYDDPDLFFEICENTLYNPISLYVMLDIEEALSIIIDDDELWEDMTIFGLKELCVRRINEKI